MIKKTCGYCEMRISSGFKKNQQHCSFWVRYITLDQLGLRSFEEKNVLYRKVEGTQQLRGCGG